jgi:hypothetical protein
MPFYDRREAITVDGNDGARIGNNTIAGINLAFGANLVINETESELGKRLNLIINGGTVGRSSLDLTGWRCIGNLTTWDGVCDNGDVAGGNVSSDILYWSDVNTWQGKFEGDDLRLPRDGDDVVVDPTWNLNYDIPAAEAPKLNSL